MKVVRQVNTLGVLVIILSDRAEVCYRNVEFFQFVKRETVPLPQRGIFSARASSSDGAP